MAVPPGSMSLSASARPRSTAGSPGASGDAPRRSDDVVAVVVALDPGPRFERTLRSLRAQDHSRLTTLVVDAGTEPVEPRVAAVAPDAFVKRLEHPSGFATAANEVLQAVSGAEWFLFCHDDVNLAPQSVRLLVEAAIQHGAVAATPKLLEWDDHERLLGVGLGLDRTARPIPTVDRRELDQGQRDGIREVPAGSSACLLVHADRFRELGGFDTLTTPRPEPTSTEPDNDPIRAIAASLGAPELGEDIDLCWRLRAAGGTVIAVPDARVAHAAEPHAPDDASALRLIARAAVARRNRLRTILTVRTGIRRWIGAFFVIVQGVIASHGLPRRTVARAVPNLSLATIRRQRRTLTHAASTQRVKDRQLDRLHAPVLGRLRSALRTELAEDGTRTWWLAQRTAGSIRRGPARVAAVLGLLLVLSWFLSARGIIQHGAAPIGQLVGVPGPTSMLRTALDGYRDVGAGLAGPSPTGLLVLGGLGTFLLGQEGLLELLLGAGALVVAAIGTGRLAASVAAWIGETAETTSELPRTRRSGDRVRRRESPLLAGVVAAAAVAANPLGANAIARGRLDTLVSLAVLPWLLRSMLEYAGRARRTAVLPGITVASVNRTQSSDVIAESRRLLLPLIVPAALAVAVAPPMLIVIVLVGLSTAAGMLFGRADEQVSGRRAAGRVLFATIAASIGAFVLLMPWSLRAIQTPSMFGHLATDGSLQLGELLRFRSADSGGSVLAVGLVIAALIVAVLADGRRFDAIAWCWTVAVASFGIAAISSRIEIDAVPSAATLLVPAAIALGVIIGLGATAFGGDLLRSEFGWRQILAVAGVVVLICAVVPRLVLVGDGRLGGPRTSSADALAWMPERSRTDGDFRVIWIGAPDVVPGSSWRLDDDLAVTISRNGVADMRSAWAPGPDRSVQAVHDAMQFARARGTNRLGTRFAAIGVRYIVLVDRAAPGFGPRRPIPDDLTRMLNVQLDMREVDLAGAGLRVFENTDWIPIRSTRTAQTTTGVLLGEPTARASGDVLTPGTFGLIESVPSRWRVRLDGRAIPSTESPAISSGPSGERAVPPIGTATALPTPGRLSVQYLPSPAQRVSQLIQGAIWIGVGAVAFGQWRRRRRALSEVLQQVTKPAPVAALPDDAAFLSDDDALIRLDERRRERGQP
jgi:GT2 family glycosyltransferase